MKILAISQRCNGATDAKIEAKLRDETSQIWRLYVDGFIREWYDRKDKPEAVLVLESPTVDTARAILDELALVRAGLIEFDLIPLIPCRSLETLMQTQGQEL